MGLPPPHGQQEEGQVQQHSILNFPDSNMVSSLAMVPTSIPLLGSGSGSTHTSSSSMGSIPNDNNNNDSPNRNTNTNVNTNANTDAHTNTNINTNRAQLHTNRTLL